MPKIVVFDSGLGSLSVRKSIQKLVPPEVIYFADQAAILMVQKEYIN